ncbi:MAG TPA: hypothetical protein VJN43_11490 [Bryobacteraceae bacterium]|nr:hypothetical protein [Bryobacteraceae bacterium]
MKFASWIAGVGLLVLLAGTPRQAAAQFPQPLATFTGAVHEIDSKSLSILQGEGEDAPDLRFVFTHKTRFYMGKERIKWSDIKPGDQVSIETKRFPDGELEAVNVRLEKKKPQ